MKECPLLNARHKFIFALLLILVPVPSHAGLIECIGGMLGLKPRDGITLPVRARIEAILAKVSGWDTSKRAEIVELSGGFTNRTYRVSNGARVVVVRLGFEGAKSMGVDREREAAIARIVGEEEVGPKLFYADPAEGVLVTQFIEGRNLTADELAKPPILRDVAHLLRRCHDGPAFPGKFDLFQSIREMHDRARAAGIVMPSETQEALAVLDKIAKALEGRIELKSIHNDFHLGNILLGRDGRLRFIDWEYAAAGDPYNDLALYAMNGTLDESQMISLLTEYNGVYRPQDLARLQLMIVATYVRCAFWNFLQSKIASSARRDYYSAGISNLSEGLALSRKPAFQRWLRNAASPD